MFQIECTHSNCGGNDLLQHGVVERQNPRQNLFDVSGTRCTPNSSVSTSRCTGFRKMCSGVVLVVSLSQRVVSCCAIFVETSSAVSFVLLFLSSCFHFSGKTGRTPLLKELNLPVSGATSALEFCNGLLT